jgi:hypothetical protein
MLTTPTWYWPRCLARKQVASKQKDAEWRREDGSELDAQKLRNLSCYLSSVVQLHDQLASGLTYKGDQNLSYPTIINRNGSIGMPTGMVPVTPPLWVGRNLIELLGRLASPIALMHAPPNPLSLARTLSDSLISHGTYCIEVDNE